jgi:GR25 family glycosyltransferase involved in LPS biosynthesis
MGKGAQLCKKLGCYLQRFVGRSNNQIPDFDLYVVHNHLLVERKAFLLSTLNRTIKAHFIEIESQAPQLLELFYVGLRDTKWRLKCEGLWHQIPAPRKLSGGEIACTTSHFYAYQQFLKESDKEWLLVIEDDAIFKPGLEKAIQKKLQKLPFWADALFVGGGFPHHIVSKTLGKYRNFLIKHHPSTNTTIAYMLRRPLVKKIIEKFEQFDLPIDYELAYLLMINNAVVFHCNPYLIAEGSKFAYPSSIRNG